MATPSDKTPRSQRPPTAQVILRTWRGDRIIGASSAQLYLEWIARFRRYCSELGLVEVDELTYRGAKRFRSWYARTRKINAAHLGPASSSMRALRRVYEVLGVPLPAWRPLERCPPPA